jgi:hypothetical protein
VTRACAELNNAVSTAASQLELIERDAARMRWRMDLECEVLLARMDVAVLRHELTR